MITAERADELLYEMSQQFTMCPKHKYPQATIEENREIMAKWKTMPGYTSFYDALLRIKKDFNLKKLLDK